MMQTSADVTGFWLDEVGETDWFTASEALDEKIRSRFHPLWQELRSGARAAWLAGPDTLLAYILVADQFPRNMFRGEAQAFATDDLARTAALRALAHDWDLRVPEPARQFMYMPFVHSELQVDQDRGVRLMKERMPQTGADNLLHARAHRDVIRRFGRFPFRNAALGRRNTAEEVAFLETGGYAATVKALQP